MGWSPRAALDPAARAGPRLLSPSEGGRLEHTDKAAALSVLTTEGAAVAIQLDRDEQLTRFYRVHADRLRHDIARRTRGLDDATIDDACAFAWEVLCRRPDIDLERYEAYWWLYKVALRQAWALGRRRHREQPMGGLNGADKDSLEPIDLDSDVADVVAERIEHASMRGVLGRLHWRERRELLLYAHGFSYQEIAKLTGTTYTAVNRWIVRGKNALRTDRARRELSGDTDCPPR